MVNKAMKNIGRIAVISAAVIGVQTFAGAMISGLIVQIPIVGSLAAGAFSVANITVIGLGVTAGELISDRIKALK